jgi:hypothetical protein
MYIGIGPDCFWGIGKVKNLGEHFEMSENRQFLGVNGRVKTSHRWARENQPVIPSLIYRIFFTVQENLAFSILRFQRDRGLYRSDRRRGENGPHKSSSEPRRRKPSGTGRSKFNLVYSSCEHCRYHPCLFGPYLLWCCCLRLCL